MTDPTVQVVAHRGASAAASENTLEAFALAAELGADWVELDVRPSLDGALVLCHDAVLADGRAVVSLRRDELPPTVPTLAEALDLCAARGLGVNVEIKALPDEPDHDRVVEVTDAVIAALVDWVDAGTSADALLVTSFDPRTIQRVHERADGGLPTGQLTFDGNATATAQAAAAGHSAINPWDPIVDSAYVQHAHELGLAVNVWTVDAPERLAELIRLGVDGLITNVPDVARTVLRG